MGVFWTLVYSMEDKDKQLKNMEELIRIQQVENETERKALLDKFEKDKNEQLEKEKAEMLEVLEDQKEADRIAREEVETAMNQQIEDSKKAMKEELEKVSAQNLEERTSYWTVISNNLKNYL